MAAGEELSAGDGAATIADETARLRTLVQMMEAERAAMRRFLDAAAIGITHFARDGTILMINEAGARNLGGTPAELEGKSILELVPALADQTRSRIETALDGGQALSVETKVTLPVGERWFRSTYRPVRDEAGIPRTVQLMSHDVTELKRMEDTLAATEGRLTSILAHAPLLIAVLERDGTFSYLNRAPEEYTLEQLVGNDASSFLPPEFGQLLSSGLRAVFDTGEPQRIEVEGNSGRHWAARLVPVLRDERVQQVLALAADVTEQHRARERELELVAQMQHAQKLESLGVLAGGIAHDFNNLLMGILGNAELALASDAPTAPEHLAGIVEAARRAAELCHQMLAYAGKSQLALETLDLATLANELLPLVRASVSKRAKLSSECHSDLPAVEGDPTQLRQVVMNLLTNAADALGDEAGEITLRCGLVTGGEADALARHEHGADRHVFVEVHDTGCGMDEDTQRRMFDPFFTTKQKGSGLGLAAVLGIVERHRGSLHVDSEPGRGTTVRIAFPASPHRPSKGPPSPAPAPDATSATILVVDDEAIVRSVAKQLLERAGYRVVEASDGAGALALYESDPAAIDAVLLDVTMPGMDGREVLERLRARTPELPAVLCSGYGPSSSDQARWSDDPLTLFIAKPFGAEELFAAIGRVLSRAKSKEPG